MVDFVNAHLLFVHIQVIIQPYHIRLLFSFVFISCPKQPGQQNVLLGEGGGGGGGGGGGDWELIVWDKNLADAEFLDELV